MTRANHAANTNALAGISPGISAPAGPKFPDLLGPGAPVNALDFEVKGNALRRTLGVSVYFLFVGISARVVAFANRLLPTCKQQLRSVARIRCS